MRKYILLLIALSLQILPVNTITAQGQDADVTLKQDTSKLRSTKALETPSLPNIILSSPEVQAMTRYGDYPTNLSAGMVDITIPLYEIKQGSLSVPVTMSFHASGRKVSDMNNTLGMDWTLNAGGIVSRKVKNHPDEHYQWISHLDDNRAPSDSYIYEFMAPYLYNKNILLGGEAKSENEFDIFSYSLPNGKSGKFILKDNNGQKEAMTIPYSPIKIEVNIAKEHSTAVDYIKINRVSITDTDGTQYVYGASGNVILHSKYMEYAGISGVGTTTAWHPNIIVSANKKDTIFFYHDSSLQFRENKQTYINVKLDFDVSDACLTIEDVNKIYQCFTGAYPNGTAKLMTYLCDIHGILFDDYGHWVDTETEFPIRHDYYGRRLREIRTKTAVFQCSLSGSSQILENITLKDLNNNPIKYWEFKYNVNLNIYTLSSFLVKDKNNQTIEKYNFDYYYENKQINPKSKDWWGYYNGMSNKYLIPRMSIGRIHSYCSNVEGDRYIGDEQVNRDVNEPFMKTGMLKSIVYPTGGKTEFDYEANRDPYGNLCGGLRIKSVINIDDQGGQQIKKYTYGKSTMHYYFQSPEYLSGLKHWSLMYFDETYNVHYWADGIDALIANINRRYSSDLPYDLFDFTSQYVHYTKITENLYRKEKNQTDEIYLGTTEYNYEGPYAIEAKEFTIKSIPVAISNKNINPKTYIDNEFSWLGGKLKSKYIYNSDKQLTKRNLYHYDYFFKDTATTVIASRFVNFLGINTGGTFVSIKEHGWSYFGNDIPSSDRLGQSIFGYAHYRLTSGAELLTEEYETIDGVTTLKLYTYEPEHLMVEKETIETINGDYETRYLYPFNKSGSVYNEMVNRNILSPVVEKIFNKDGTFLQKESTEYYKPYDNIYVPSVIKYQGTTSGSLEPRITFHGYNDRGNPLYISKDDATRIIYIWSYSGQYPIAEIKNATYEEVKQALGWSDSYINTLSGKIVPSGDDMNKINALRNSLPNAHISTYEYQLLIGLTKVTDPRGITTTYEYDDSGRLKTVKDHQGNPVESFQYNYRNK